MKVQNASMPEKQVGQPGLEIACQIGLTDLATILYFHSVGYRDHLVREIEKMEPLFFGLTGPTELVTHQKNWRMLSKSVNIL